MIAVCMIAQHDKIMYCADCRTGKSGMPLLVLPAPIGADGKAE